MIRAFRHGTRVRTIYGDGTVVRVLISAHGQEAWVNLDRRPDEQHCSFPVGDTRANHVLCYADECEELKDGR